MCDTEAFITSIATEIEHDGHSSPLMARFDAAIQIVTWLNAGIDSDDTTLMDKLTTFCGDTIGV